MKQLKDRQVKYFEHSRSHRKTWSRYCCMTEDRFTRGRITWFLIWQHQLPFKLFVESSSSSWDTLRYKKRKYVQNMISRYDLQSPRRNCSPVPIDDSKHWKKKFSLHVVLRNVNFEYLLFWRENFQDLKTNPSKTTLRSMAWVNLTRNF